MAVSQFFVVLHHGSWVVRHDQRLSGPFSTRRAALHAAADTARRASRFGYDAQLLVQRRDNTLRAIWPLHRAGSKGARKPAQ